MDNLKKKTPIGIYIISILFFMIAIGGTLFMLLLQGVANAWTGHSSGLLNFLINLIPLVFLIPAIFILKAKNWARIFSIILAGVIIIASIGFGIFAAKSVGYNFLETLFAIGIVRIIGATIIIVYLLTDKKIKEFFKN